MDAYEIPDDDTDYTSTLYHNSGAVQPARAEAEAETEEKQDPTESWWWIAGQMALNVLGVGGLGVAATKITRRIRKGGRYDNLEEALGEAKEVIQHVTGAIDLLPEGIKVPVLDKLKYLTNKVDRIMIEDHVIEARETILFDAAAREVGRDGPPKPIKTNAQG